MQLSAPAQALKISSILVRSGVAVQAVCASALCRLTSTPANMQRSWNHVQG